MAFGPPELVAIRRHAGYPAAGATPTTDPLATKLDDLSPDEEMVILDVYLPALDRLEAAIPLAGDTLDTKQAAVWHRNPTELAERVALYMQQRIALCTFLGVDPGPGIPAVPPPLVPGTDGGGGTAAAPPWLPPEVFVV